MPEQKSLPPPHLLALQILGQRPPGFPAEHACMRIKGMLHSAFRRMAAVGGSRPNGFASFAGASARFARLPPTGLQLKVALRGHTKPHPRNHQHELGKGM